MNIYFVDFERHMMFLTSYNSLIFCAIIFCHIIHQAFLYFKEVFETAQHRGFMFYLV